MNRILPNQDRAVIAVIALGAITFLRLILRVVIYYKVGNLYSDSVFEPDQEVVLDIFSLYGVFVIVQAVLLVICAIAFIRWFRRAYANLERMGSDFLSYREYWAAGSWFVPIGNLFLPYRIMNEIWIETQANLRPDSPHKEDNGLPLIGWWWGCWVFYNIASYIFRTMSRGGYGVSGLYYTVRLDLLAEIISIPACILAILVVRKLSAMEKDLVEPNQVSDPMDHLIA